MCGGAAGVARGPVAVTGFFERVRRHGLWALALLLVGITGPPVAAAPSGTYRIAPAPDLSAIDVRACFAAPVTLRPLDPRGLAYLDGLRVEQPPDPVRWLGDVQSVSLEEGCLVFRFDLQRALEEAGRRARRVGEDVMLSPNLLLWLPSEARSGPHVVHLALPAGIQASVPWPELEEGPGLHRYVPGPRGWQPIVVFGHPRLRALQVGDTRLRLVLLDGLESGDAGRIEDWLRSAASTLLTVTGSFPVPRPQVLVVPTSRRGTRSAVPFARVLRDGGTAVQFYVNPGLERDSLTRDWTAAHEFAHLLLPFVDQRDAWISEGFASYYQNVLRARAGVVSEERAWRDLAAGFERGRRGAVDGRFSVTLRSSMAGAGKNRSMRRYWTGAAVALIADLELRTRADEGPRSLDDVLAQLAACCLPSERSWGGRELFERLDVLASTELFVPLYDRMVQSCAFPELAQAWERLGLEVDGRSVRVVEASSRLRAAIMGARAEADAYAPGGVTQGEASEPRG